MTDAPPPKYPQNDKNGYAWGPCIRTKDPKGSQPMGNGGTYIEGSGTVMTNIDWTEEKEWCYVSEDQGHRVKGADLPRQLKQADAKDNKGNSYKYLVKYSCLSWSARPLTDQNEFGGCTKSGQSIIMPDGHTPMLGSPS